jgi:lipoprotein-releasing system permease protein
MIRQKTKPATKAFAAFEWMLAGRYLRARRKEGFISVIAGFSFAGIMLGVATLIIVMAVMNGFRKELLGKILGIQGHIVIQALDSPLTDYDQLSKKFMDIRGIKAAVPIVEGQALANSPYASSGVIVRGVRGADFPKLPLLAGSVKHGTLEGFDTGGGVMIGQRLANQLSLKLGDNMSLIAPKGAEGPFGMLPRIKNYKIAAIFEVGMTEYDSAFVFLPFNEAQAYFNREDDATSIEIYTDNPDEADKYRKLLNAASDRGMFTVDWRQRNATFFSALQVERNVMFMILTLIVIVAALNIISGLIMLVKDKGRDVAILRTMGATKGSIMRVFMITGAAIGVGGTLAGFALGLLVCFNIKAIQNFASWVTGTTLWDPTVRFLTEIPAVVNPSETIAVLIMALTLSFIATLFPSFKAAKLDPVEALRYE